MAWIGANKESYSVGVIGMGYVGLPLGLLFARKGCKVIGFDIDERKIEKLKENKKYIKHINLDDLPNLIQEGGFVPTSDFTKIGETDAVIITVPTPLTKNREPDISFILSTGEVIGKNLKKGMLVVLESTTYPGCTDDDLRPIIEKESGLKAGEDFHLAFSPERESPGDPGSSTEIIPKVVGGYTESCRDAAVLLYSKAVKKVVPVRDNCTAEATKLYENIFRSVNIALVNELKVIFERMSIDIWDVIEAAKTKPFGFMPFYPGPGLGGHCIPIDPFYLTWKAREHGMNTRFIELAGEINTKMPEQVLSKLIIALNGEGKAVRGSQILIVGTAYKKNVDDDRESPAYRLIDLIERESGKCDYHDPHLPVIRPSREYGHLVGRESQVIDATKLKEYDCVLIVTDHDEVDYSLIGEYASLVVDTRNAMSRVDKPKSKIFKV